MASSAPLDQYIIEHPEYFFDRPPEHAHINPDNLEILINHLKCAAFELPMRDGEKFGPHDTGELCRFLEDLKFLHHSGGGVALDLGYLSRPTPSACARYRATTSWWWISPATIA